jgi:murein L,D-transpeptidase YcbB/YkuD
MILRVLNRIKRSCCIVFAGLFVSGSKAQTISPLQQFLNDDSKVKSAALQYPAEVKTFYQFNQYKFAWLNDNSNQQILLQLLRQSPDCGLQEKDYYFPFLKISLATLNDSLLAEIRYTDAAIHFFHDVAYGNTTPVLGYNGLDYFPGCFDIPELLVSATSKNQLLSFPSFIEPKAQEYISIKKQIQLSQKIIALKDFTEIIIKSNKADSSNKSLLIKLYQLGIIDSATQKFAAKELKERIKSAQKLFSLLSDGVLRNTTLEALNVSLQVRLEELKQALNTIRWLSCIKQSQKVIVVNIPSANLLVYDRGNVILESRVIAGKKLTPTPTLCSKVTEVILYPYWMVPYKIATKELLPSIKRNTGYLEEGNYQVMDAKGRVVNPCKINWKLFSKTYFPYTIRQSTGCDNALGLVKLNFFNPYTVYLHDTPMKSLFSLNKRYFSHGCMRVEKAMELAHLVLKNNAIAVDTLEAKGCLRNQSPITVPADEIIPVFVLYNTAWINGKGKIGFYEDIYEKEKSLKKKF